MRQAALHARGAFAASWHEARGTALEDWWRPPEVGSEYLCQKEASALLDRAAAEELLASASSDRERQRLRRIAQPHAAGFITATPSEVDGSETILRPRIFQVAMAYRLGCQVARGDTLCPQCNNLMDQCGDHATLCMRSGDVIMRHNALRNLVNDFANLPLLNPVMEKEGILGSAPGDARVM